jgi:choline dehydrogenase-like flavoprotein
VACVGSTVHKGIRQSAAIAYLNNLTDNLTIFTNRHIARVVFEGSSAVVIETVAGEVIRAGRELILCQVTFGTPQTLMLSGVGLVDHLVSHGITPVVDLPGVGEHPADHPDVSMQYGSDRMDLSHARNQRLGKAATLMAQWFLFGKGRGSGSMFSTTLFHAFDDPAFPELEVFMTPMVVEKNLGNREKEETPLLQRFGRKLLVRSRKSARSGIQIDINQERPKSLGTVRLASADPCNHPLIDPNYFADPHVWMSLSAV